MRPAGATGLVAALIVYVTTLVGAISLVTGAVGFCALYAILRLSTAPARAACVRARIREG
ncbi:MAG: YgaP-like transmembrane domain [Candidatus Limnocylindrales bacterium]